MKRYAELIGNYKKYWIKSQYDNTLDYRGEIMAALHNDTEEGQVVFHGDRIAQLVIMPYLPVEFTEVDELPETVRGDGGFGSTGK